MRALLAATISLGLAACGADEEPMARTPAPPVSTTVDVALLDYAFADLPAEVDAGTRFTVTNRSETELHELVAFRLPKGDQRSVADLARLAPDQLVAALGEPATVLLAAPGRPMITAVGDGTLVEPGRYAIMCFIPTGANPDEYLAAAAETEEGPPQGVAGGPPHFVHGMFAELEIR